MKSRLTAKQFWNSFRREVRNISSDRPGAAWTASMTKVLHNVQSAHQLFCQWRDHSGSPNGRSGERMDIDFTWYEKGDDEWVPPLVAIEHENKPNDLDRQRDHWKVNMIATPLRVFIGYAKASEQVEDTASTLTVHARKWLPVEGGEALIVLGYPEMGSDFRAWSAPQGVDAWKELAFVS